MVESCLVDKLSHYSRLTEADRDVLVMLEEHEQSYAEGDVVHEAGDRTEELYVVKSGWLFSSFSLTDGRRQIVRIHHEGDIVGLPDIAFPHATVDVTAVNTAVLCPFPRKHLDVIIKGHPRLTALLFSISLREQVVLIDHLRRIGRMNARERVGHFLLDLMARLRITNLLRESSFYLPLTQSEIGDALGLTNITVSKTLMDLRMDKLIRVERSQVTLLEENKLREESQFIDRYRDLDTSWFPEPADV